MRSLKLILTLAVLGMIAFLGAFLWFPSSTGAMQVHATILTVIGVIAGLTTTFTLQAVGKMEKLREVKLSPIQLQLFRAKIQKRKGRLWMKWAIGMITALTAVVTGQCLKLVSSGVLLGVAYASLSVACLLVVLLVVEYFTMSNLSEVLSESSERQQSRRHFFGRLRHHPTR